MPGLHALYMWPGRSAASHASQLAVFISTKTNHLMTFDPDLSTTINVQPQARQHCERQDKRAARLLACPTMRAVHHHSILHEWPISLPNWPIQCTVYSTMEL